MTEQERGDFVGEVEEVFGKLKLLAVPVDGASQDAPIRYRQQSLALKLVGEESVRVVESVPGAAGDQAEGIAVNEEFLIVNLSEGRQLRIFHSNKPEASFGGLEWRVEAMLPERDGKKKHAQVRLWQRGGTEVEIDCSDESGLMLGADGPPLRSDFDTIWSMVREAGQYA